MDDQPHRQKPIWQRAPTRRDTLLFGFLLLASVWSMMSHYPIKVISVPDTLMSVTRVV
jgi:hypothetical protein